MAVSHSNLLWHAFARCLQFKLWRWRSSAKEYDSYHSAPELDGNVAIIDVRLMVCPGGGFMTGRLAFSNSFCSGHDLTRKDDVVAADG